MLPRARMRRLGARRVPSALLTLEHGAAYAAHSKLDGGGKPGRSRSDDDDMMFGKHWPVSLL